MQTIEAKRSGHAEEMLSCRAISSLYFLFESWNPRPAVDDAARIRFLGGIKPMVIGPDIEDRFAVTEISEAGGDGAFAHAICPLP